MNKNYYDIFLWYINCINYKKKIKNKKKDRKLKKKKKKFFKL